MLYKYICGGCKRSPHWERGFPVIYSRHFDCNVLVRHTVFISLVVRMLRIKQMCGYSPRFYSPLCVRAWMCQRRVCGLRCGGSPRTRSTPDARCHWRRSGSSASLTARSRRTWEKRVGRSPRCSTASHPFPRSLGQGSEQPGLIVGHNEWNYFQLFFWSRSLRLRPPARLLTVRSKQAAAVCTEEVLGVPGLVQRCQDVLVKPARKRGVTSCFCQLMLRFDWPRVLWAKDMKRTRTVTHRVSHKRGSFTTGFISVRNKEKKALVWFNWPDHRSGGKQLHTKCMSSPKRRERSSGIFCSCVLACVTSIPSSWHMHPLTALSHLQNGPLAVGTVRGEESMVVLLTVRATLSLKEPRVAQLLVTRCAHKVLRVPHLAQCCDNLQEHGENYRGARPLLCILCMGNLWDLPFPRCLYCRIHSCPSPLCAHRSSPDQSSAHPAGRQWHLLFCSCLYRKRHFYCCRRPLGPPLLHPDLCFSRTVSFSAVGSLGALNP